MAAGESLLAIHNPGSTAHGTGIHISLVLELCAGLVISIVMLRSHVFGKAAVCAGIVANGAGLASYVTLILAPELTAIPHVIAGPFRLVWYVLIAVGLLRLARKP